MKSAKGKICRDRLLEEIDNINFFDSLTYELENYNPSCPYSILFGTNCLFYEVSGLTLEETYDLCGVLKAMIELTYPQVKFASWERQDWPDFHSVDFKSYIDEHHYVRITSMPSDCKFVEVGVKTSPILKMECGGDKWPEVE